MRDLFNEAPELFIGGIAVVVVLVVSFIVTLVRQRRNFSRIYQKTDGLFTEAELRFLRILESAVGDDARVYAKVRMADLISVRDGISGKRFWNAFHPIASKHVDYVLCEPLGRLPICAIELDDSSHLRPDRQERDEFVDAVMAAVGLPLRRFPVQSRYKVAEVRESLSDVLRQH